MDTIETTACVCNYLVRLHAAGKSIRATLLDNETGKPRACPVFIQFTPYVTPIVDGVGLLQEFEQFLGDASIAENYTRAQYLRHIAGGLDRKEGLRMWAADKSKLRRVRTMFGGTGIPDLLEEVNRAILATEAL